MLMHLLLLRAFPPTLSDFSTVGLRALNYNCDEGTAEVWHVCPLEDDQGCTLTSKAEEKRPARAHACLANCLVDIF